MKISRKRLLVSAGGITAVGAVAALVVGSTLGLFSATSPAQTDALSAGTVTLTQPVNVNCTLTNIVPGDSNTSQCSFTIQYTGSVPADLGLDIAVTGTAGTNPTVPPYSGTPDYAAGAPGLFDGTADGLQLTVSNGATTFVSGTHYKDASGTNHNLQSGLTTDPTANGAGSATGGIHDLWIGTDSSGAATRTITIGYSAPSTMDNSYQNAATTLSLTVHAVQHAHNTTGTCTAGWVGGCVNGWS